MGKGVVAIGKSMDNRFFMKLAGEYRKSLKPSETEELVNQLINRPLGFGAAKCFQKVKATPNFVTLLSLLCGLSAGVVFSRAKYPEVLWAALLLQGMIIFDCADGQLARLTGRSSKFGRIIDTFADLTTHAAVYWGVAVALYKTSGFPVVWLLALLSQVSMYLHMALFDHFKNVYITVARPDYGDLLDSLKKMKEASEKMGSSGGRLSSIVAKMYVWFYKMESRVVSLGYPSIGVTFYEVYPDSEHIDDGLRELYTREMRVPTKLWTMIGDTIHLEIFVVCGVLSRLSFIFPLILIYTNAVMIIALLIQRTKYRNLGLEREGLLQERFD
jgi:phosphatidylglycerophosphate synthase